MYLTFGLTNSSTPSSILNILKCTTEDTFSYLKQFYNTGHRSRFQPPVIIPLRGDSNPPQPFFKCILAVDAVVLILTLFTFCALSRSRQFGHNFFFFQFQAKFIFTFVQWKGLDRENFHHWGGVSLYRRPPVYFASIQLLCSC